jgi:hypothetical protein
MRNVYGVQCNAMTVSLNTAENERTELLNYYVGHARTAFPQIHTHVHLQVVTQNQCIFNILFLQRGLLKALFICILYKMYIA